MGKDEWKMDGGGMVEWKMDRGGLGEIEPHVLRRRSFIHTRRRSEKRATRLCQDRGRALRGLMFILIINLHPMTGTPVSGQDGPCPKKRF